MKPDYFPAYAFAGIVILAMAACIMWMAAFLGYL